MIQINKNILVSFFIFNSGSNYSKNDLQFFKFYKIDSEYSKYNELTQDNNNNDINIPPPSPQHTFLLSLGVVMVLFVSVFTKPS